MTSRSTIACAATRTTIEVHRAEHGFERVGQDRRLLGPTRRGLAAAEPDVRPEVDLRRHVGERQRVHDALAEVGELTFGRVIEPPVRDVGDRPTEHRIAEELQPLVAQIPGMLRAPRPMIERLIEQRPIGEPMTDAPLQCARGRSSPRRRDSGAGHGQPSLRLWPDR